MHGYEEIDHTADWALRLRGKDMSELCLHGATAMLAACGARAEDRPPSERRISLQGGNREVLLVRWLQEVLYTLDVHRRLPVHIEVHVSDGLELESRWKEQPLAGIEKPIKAVTYGGLTVEDTEDGLEATVVFDV